MKLADRTIDTHSAGVASRNQFNIAQTSKMFKILSDSLYSDKVMAAIRELSTNAYDSHISAGNKNPFKVTLPTAANPTFIVRDYGTGLSQADMENLYTTYGASNKNDSNDFVGCLGLGSKSPFAYTKSFTTSSYFNGKKYTYVAAIDESGVPTLNLFNTSNTSEPNGLEISFAVKQHDFQEFSDKAKRIFHYFRMKPIIEGGIGNNLQDHKYSNTNIVISGDGWRVCRLNNDTQYYPNTYQRIDSGVIAIMGNIAYPVQTAQIVGQEKEEMPDHIQKWNRAFQKADIDSWKSFVSEIINAGLYLELDFGIGELEMDVSREGLQYTKDVIKALRKKTQEIYMEMKEEFSKKIQEAKTKVEAISLYYTMNELAGGWGVGATWTDSNGKDHSINSGNDLEYKIPAGKNLYVVNYKTAGYRSRRMITLTDKIHHETLTGKGYSYWNNVKKSGKLAFFVCDVKGEETAKKIVIKYCNQNDCFAYIMIDPKDHTKSGVGFDKLIEDVGSDNILKISDYKHLTQHTGPRKVGVRNSNGSISDQDVFFIYGHDKDSKSITNPYNDATFLKMLTEDQLENFLEQDEIIYVPMLRYKTEADSDCPEIQSISRIFTDAGLNSIVKDLAGDNKIYAIKNAFVKKLKNEGYNLVSFNTFFNRQLKTVTSKHFAKLESFNGLVESCKKDFYHSQEEQSGSYRYNNYGSTEKQFLFHILNIFGLDYAKFIKNQEMVDILNKSMITEFFAKTVHDSTFRIEKFNQSDYFAHISNIMKGMGMDSVEPKDIRSANIAYNTLSNLITNCLYVGANADKGVDCLKIIRGDSNNKLKTWTIKDIRDSLKKIIDQNPMVKFIMGIHQVGGDLSDLGKKNPISQLDDTRSYYNNSKNWITQMSQENIDLFKIQFSSLIK
ncbi:MAG: hypothetical protein EBZ62_00810 [Sphingobacteriia bacterium]|nr:hypothetical protein [Sphingobacteriia bacterium]